MKALKVFKKSFEAPQRSVKTKIYFNFFSSSGIGKGRVKYDLKFSVGFYTLKYGNVINIITWMYTMHSISE